MIMSNTTSNSINEILESQNQPIEYIAFSGGGAKGAGYSGVNKALIDSGIIRGIKALSGSSAGAIAASVIACGISSEEYYELSQNTNMKGLLTKTPKLIPIKNDGQPLLELVDTTIRNVTGRYLNEIDIKEFIKDQIEIAESVLNVEPNNIEIKSRIEGLKQIKDNGCEALFAIKNKMDHNGSLTFKELETLHIMNPEKFKELIITATRLDNGELVIFNSKNSPDVLIADATRASASFPIVFKPHKINGIKYIDGGYRDNIPIKYFDGQEFKKDEDSSAEEINNLDEIKKSNGQKRTMAFAFGNDMNAEANIAIYSSKKRITTGSEIIKFLMDVVLKLLVQVGGAFKYTDEEEKMYQRVRDNSLNTVILGTADVSTLSFDKAQEKSAYLHTKAYLQTMEYVQNHELGQFDLNLGEKNLIISVYEDAYKKSWTTSLFDKIIGGHENKLNDILFFAQEETWKDKSSSEILYDFIVKASTKRTDGNLTTETRTMTNLIDKLNDPYTSDKIKLEFVELLKIDLDKNKNLKDLKFTQKDFESILNQANNKKRLDDNLSQKNSFVEKESDKNILRESDKSK